MKRLEDFTDKELANLNTDEIEQLIFVEAANRGIKLKQPMPTLTPLPNAENDLPPGEECFCLGDIYFPTKEGANAALLAGAFKCSYEYPDYEHKYKNSGVDITVTRIYPQDALKAYAQKLRTKNSIKEKNDALIKEWEAESKDFDDLTEEIHEAVSAAYSRWSLIRSLNNTLERYLSLANGDEEVAKNFFVSAYSEADYQAVLAFREE